MGNANAPTVTNFGGNVVFTPARHYVPRNEKEVLAILDKHARGKVRVLGARHSWSEALVTEDALVDMRRFRHVRIERDADGTAWATIGGGCTLKRALALLNRADLTLPALGLITEQTIAGAISTGTHGSGRSSISHYIAEVRVAAYDVAGRARIYVWSAGPELRAARCALGCMGVILSVKICCVPQYLIEESVRRCERLDDVLAGEAEHPLQQFYLAPHAWVYYVQQRRAAPAPSRRSWYAGVYRLYWFLIIDLALHWTIKIFAAWLSSRRLVHFLFRFLLPLLLWKPRGLRERSDAALIMEHELFRHLEIEIFVPGPALRRAADFVRQVLEVFDGKASVDPAWAETLRKHDLLSRLLAERGVFTFHYPITFRRVLPDDTLISMTAQASEPWYAVSFITYVEPRDAFYRLARFLAESMTTLFGARLHWGKYFPLDQERIAGGYPGLAEFREICRDTDPRGVFRNRYVERVLGYNAPEGVQS
ncbi:MAG: FAD-binding protein [Gemmataceae bacterium]